MWFHSPRLTLIHADAVRIVLALKFIEAAIEREKLFPPASLSASIPAVSMQPSSLMPRLL
jgi:hypothetical protein